MQCQRDTQFIIHHWQCALKGRQITDGGKQRAAPGYGKLITPPPCADGARAGVRGRVWHGDGGHASLTPVCALSPLQGVFAKGGVVACWWVLCEKAVCEGTKGQKRPRDFCVLFPYLSLFCLSGALACYLSLSGLSVVAHAARRKSICGACVFAGIGDRT